MADYLPVSYEEMKAQGFQELDFVYVIGDAYVDHPSFGHAVISRILQANGYSVGIISQPDWKRDESIRLFGRPRLGFLVTAGNMDSMVNHYYVSKKKRREDAYTPGGLTGKRPDYATIVYCNLIRRSYKNVPIIIGGVEASLRRLAHYDYWSDSFRHSILIDSQADLLSYGMGERSIVEIARALDSGMDIKDITYIPGTVYKTRDLSGITGFTDEKLNALFLPSYEAMKKDKLLYAKSFSRQYQNTDALTGRILAEEYENGIYVVQNPPSKPLTTQEMDDVYELPYMRSYHPSYEELGGVPAIREVRFSLVSSRGCFGGCSFCALTFHQGRTVQARSHASLIREAEKMIREPDFKGYIHDVGGPTANFRRPACEKQKERGVCMEKQCLFPKPCKNLVVDHSDYLALLRKLRTLPGVKKVFIRSGIRFDYLLADPDDTFFREMVQYHISGQLKVAPEHVSDAVLEQMGKPKRAVYDAFIRKYESLNGELHLQQYLVPYLMSSHPGSSLKEAIELAVYLKERGCMPEQVQDFYPTPSTVSTVMYYTGVDPRSGKPVYVCRNPHEKAMQRALIRFRDPANHELVKEALLKEGRADLIGFDQQCLIWPRKPAAKQDKDKTSKRKPGKSGVQKRTVKGKKHEKDH